jgi:hypothetical protein
MKAIVSGRSGKALIIDAGSLKSFDVDDPSNVVSRQPADLPYLFGDASDLRAVEHETVEAIANELRGDCNLTLAVDLTLISLDREVEYELRLEALDGLSELLMDETTAAQLKNVFYAEPLPEDADFRAVLLCDKGLPSDFLIRLRRHQPVIFIVKRAWTAIPVRSFGTEEAREAFRRAAIKGGLFHILGRALFDAGVNPKEDTAVNWEPTFRASLERYLFAWSTRSHPYYRKVIDDWTSGVRRALAADNDRSEKKLAG